MSRTTYSAPNNMVSGKTDPETQLLELLEDLMENMESGRQTGILIVIMDFTKIFDTAHHSLLLHQLHHYGIREEVNRWAGSFLMNR